MFGIAKDIRSEVRECTPDLLNQALDSAHVARVCAEIEDALEKCRRGEITKEEYETIKSALKKKLPIFTFHAMFKNGRRKNGDAIPSGLSIYDLDHIENPRAKWAEIEARKAELGILLSHISPSLEGLRLVFRRPPLAPPAGGESPANGVMSLVNSQAWMAQQLGDTQYDACVKDYARCSFAVPREYVLWLDADGLFFDRTQRHKDTEALDSFSDGVSKPTAATSPSSSVVQGTELPSLSTDRHLVNPLKGFVRPSEGGGTHQIPLTKGVGGCSISNENEAKNLGSTAQQKVDAPEILRRSAPLDDKFPSTYEDIPYETIVQTLEEQMGGQPEHGSRNTFIFSMACHLRYITNDDSTWIARILPTYGEARDKWLSTIRSACARSQTKQMPRILRRTLAICKSQGDTQVPDAETPPEMPKRLPPLIKLLVSKTPKIYQPAVAHAVFPALATHLWKTYFRYIDNVEHEATLMCCLMAGTGAGKNCISEPINRILADIRQRDADNLQREKEWKAEMQTKGANKDKRKRPEGLVVQEIDPDMTNAAFVQRLADAEERFLYTKMNEIDQFDALKTSARSKAHFQIMCLAFDPGNVYGQTRVGTGSVSERVCIRFNWNASTTIHKGQAYFQSVLTDGPISRINFCTIPEQPIGSDVPVYGTYDPAFDEELRPYIDRLSKARGLVECRGAHTLAKKLKEENAEFARLSQSRVYENLSFRANVIAYLKAMVLFVAHGGVWDKTMEEFVRWSLRYDLWCKMRFFGDAIETQEATEGTKKNKGPQNLLDLLPEIFTREEAGALRTRVGIRNGSLSQMLNNWKGRGYIELYGEEVKRTEVSRQRYIKTEEYLRRHGGKMTIDN